MQQRLLKDVQAGFDGDPAAKSKEEIVSSYPGLFAIYVYRLAHILYKEEVKDDMLYIILFLLLFA